MKNPIIRIVSFVLFTVLLLMSARFVYIKSLIKYNHTRLYPIGSREIQIDTTLVYDYVLLGDSHAEKWNLENVKTLNLGISGQTSAQIHARYALNYQSLQANNLLLSVGANDIKCISTAPNDSIKIVENCIKNIEKILQIAKNKYKNTRCAL